MTIKVTEYGGPRRLRVGDIVTFEEARRIVVLVNQSRAVLTSVNSRSVSFTDTATGKPVKFTSLGSDLISISPESEITVERSLGVAGVEYWRKHKKLPL